MDETQGTNPIQQPYQAPQQQYQQQYQQQQYQQQYQQPMMNPEQKPDSSLTLGQWVLTIFLTMIPFVGFIMTLVWSFGSTTAPAKKNWARATLVWMLIGIVVSIITMLFFGATLAAIIAADPDVAYQLQSVA